MRAFVVILFVAAAGASSCAPFADIPFATITHGNNCRGASANTLMIQNENQIPADWKKEWFGNAGFDNHTGFAIALGLQNSGGFAVSIRTIRADADGGVLVSYQTSAPQPGDFVTQALTHPCHIVRTPKITGNAAFQNIAADK